MQRYPGAVAASRTDPYNPDSSQIRAMWKRYESWLLKHEENTRSYTQQVLELHSIRSERIPEVQEILAGRHLYAARNEWIQRLRLRGAHPYLWVLTKEEKEMLKELLDWNRTDMINAYSNWEEDLEGEYDEALDNLIAEEERVRLAKEERARIKALGPAAAVRITIS